jgi:acetyl esterase/lipase
MKPLHLTPLLLSLVGCVAAAARSHRRLGGRAARRDAHPKPGQDPRGTINKQTHRGDVFIPEFVVYPAAKPGAPLVIVCPGGGYGILAETHEGSEVAKRLNAFGSAAVVLKYRVPRRDPNKPWVVPVMDARETLRIVRARAAEWNADPKKIGILGFSAGGNLAARVAYGAGRPRRAASRFRRDGLPGLSVREG